MTVPESSPYYRFRNDDLLLRDLLAVERTVAANERTLMGFMRTALALTVAGLSLMKFFDSLPLAIVGWGLCGAALPIAAIGIARYKQRRAGLKPLLQRVS